MEKYPRIEDIPFEDILILLEKNDIRGGKHNIKVNSLTHSKNDLYKFAEDAILSDKINDAPDSVIYYMLAYNALQKYPNMGNYNISFIMRATDNELLELTKQLGLRKIDKNNIIAILGYMGKLKDDLSLLPDEVVLKILENLDYKQIYTLTKSSKKLQSEKIKELLERKYYTSRFTGKRSGPTTKFHVSTFYIVDKFLTPYGEDCKNFDKEELIDIMWEIGVKLDFNYIEDRNLLINSLMNKVPRPKNVKWKFMEWSLDKLNFYYEAYNNYYKKDKEKLCTMIEERMAELGSLRYVK